MLAESVLAGVGLTAATAVAGWMGARRKGLHRWLPEYIRTRSRRLEPDWQQPMDVLIAVCDHYEPKRDGASPAKARKRVQQWLEEYPQQFESFRDHEGRPPRHTFFYPEEEYEPEYLDMLAELCRAGFGEVEIHLHHDNDTAENLRQTLLRFKTTLAERHQLLSSDSHSGDIAYGFIHGNWALDNCRSDGRYCGVNQELNILRETGCYADFTYPSAPSETQTRTINRIYWATDDPLRPKSHNTGIPIEESPQQAQALLMIPGPLLLDWDERKLGILPRIENSCLQKSQPPSKKRFKNWLRSGVIIDTRPEWRFVKLHTHGVHEPNQDILLGEPMVQFHRDLAELSAIHPLFRFHYVTAREMTNLALAVASGWTGSVAGALNHRYRWLGSPQTRVHDGSEASPVAHGMTLREMAS